MADEDPDLIFERSGPGTDEEKKDWIRAQYKAGEEKGMTHRRVCHHPANKDRIIYEGWRVKPKDEGAPRWQDEDGAA